VYSLFSDSFARAIGKFAGVGSRWVAVGSPARFTLERRGLGYCANRPLEAPLCRAGGEDRVVQDCRGLIDRSLRRSIFAERLISSLGINAASSLGPCFLLAGAIAALRRRFSGFSAVRSLHLIERSAAQITWAKPPPCISPLYILSPLSIFSARPRLVWPPISFSLYCLSPRSSSWPSISSSYLSIYILLSIP